MALSYTALKSWTDHVAVAGILAAITQAEELNDALCELRQPDVYQIDDARSYVGCMVSARIDRLSGFMDRTEAPSHGLCVVDELWSALDAIRDNWIRAKLDAEGLRSDLNSDAYYDRHEELSDAADTVAQAWTMHRCQLREAA